MSRDGTLCLVAIGLSLLLAWRSGMPVSVFAPGHAIAATEIVDASGYRVPVSDYQRIAAVSTVATQLLPELVSTERMVLVSQWYQESHRYAFRTAHIPRVSGSDHIEAIVAAQPDLVVINNFQMQPAVVERLRSLGLNVFDLGPLDGPPTLLRNMRDLAQLLQVPERGEAMADRLVWRLERLGAHIAPEKRRRALYLDRYGDQVVGATRGSSYHHVLSYAGLVDAANERGFPPWPVLESEQIISMRPEVIVTSQGGAQRLRTLPGLQAIPLLYVELPAGYDSTGPDVLELSEWVFRQVYVQPK